MSGNLPKITFWIIDRTSWTMGAGQRGTRYIRVEEPCEESIGSKRVSPVGTTGTS